MQGRNSLDVSFFQCFLRSLITLAIPSLGSTPGVNIFTPFCVCVYKRVSPLWFVLNLKPEVTINGSDYFLAVSYWLSLSLISELLSQGDAGRVEIGGGEQAGRWGGAEEKLDRSLAVYLKAALTECTWRGGKNARNLQIRETGISYPCQNWDSFFPRGLFIYMMTVVPLDLFWSPKLFH